MSEPKWTPGPWVAIPTNYRMHVLDGPKPRYDDGLWAVLPAYNVTRIPIATADHADDAHPPCREKAQYDAQLIAAAPELYFVVERFIHYHDGVARCESAEDVQECLCSVCMDARAALAKARGEA